MKKIVTVAIVVSAVFLSPSSYALDLLGGLLNASMDAAGKVGSAVYNKATEDTPEEAAAKRKKNEDAAEANHQKVLAGIETEEGFTPLQREHARLSYEANYRTTKEYLAGQEARDNARREANSRAVSGAGLASAVGGSLVSGAEVAVSPNNPRNMSDSQMIAQGREMQRASQPKIDIATAAAAGSSSGAEAAHRAAMATAATPEQAAAAMDKVEQQSGIAAVRQQMQAAASREVDYALVDTNSALFTFEQDKSRKVFVEFVGSPKLTGEILASLRTAGYNVVDKAADADVQFQFQGDYFLDGAQSYNPLGEDAGAIYEGKAIPAPTKKSVTGSIVRGLFGAMTGMKVTEPTNQSFRQEVLVIVNRHSDGKDSRVSSLVVGRSQEIKASGMVDMAIKDLFAKAGLNVEKNIAVSQLK